VVLVFVTDAIFRKDKKKGTFICEQPGHKAAACTYGLASLAGILVKVRVRSLIKVSVTSQLFLSRYSRGVRL